MSPCNCLTRIVADSFVFEIAFLHAVQYLNFFGMSWRSCDFLSAVKDLFLSLSLSLSLSFPLSSEELGLEMVTVVISDVILSQLASCYCHVLHCVFLFLFPATELDLQACTLEYKKNQILRPLAKLIHLKSLNLYNTPVSQVSLMDIIGWVMPGNISVWKKERCCGRSTRGTCAWWLS